jgi:transposase-like protein
MQKQTRRKFTAEFKARVALEAAKDQFTLAELSKKYEVNSVVISRWKAELLANLSMVFEKTAGEDQTEEKVDIEKLYAQIGQLKVENDFLKKSAKRLGI